MAAKLQVRLTFEGGEEMNKALKELGVTGEKSFQKIGKAANAITGTFRAIGSVVEATIKTVTVFTGVVGTATAAVFALAKSSANAADEAGKTAQKVGVNAQQLQRLAFAAKLADVEAGTLQTGLTILAKNIVAASKGNKELDETFRKLGIRLLTTKPMSEATRRFMLFTGELHKAEKVAITADEALLRLSDIFRKMPDGTQKTALAVQLLGRSGAELIPLLNGGRQEIQGLMKEADELGLVFDGKAIKASEEFNDTLTRLEASFTGVKNAIGQLFIPELTRLASQLKTFLVENREEIVAWVKKGWDLVIQVIKDLVALFQGREADVVNTWLITARDNLVKALEVAQAVGSAILKIVEYFGMLEQRQQQAFRAVPARPDGIVPRFKGGGRVWGAGTGTSDSILARLSKGEFVVRAAMADKFAPLLHAINTGMVPAFADGGSVGGRPVTLNIGDDSFAMSASESIVGKLSRFSRAKALRSPGRKPSWVR